MKRKPVGFTRFDESGKVVYQNNDALNKSEVVKEKKHVSPARSTAEAKDFVFFTRCFGKKVYLTVEEALKMKDSCVIEKECK